MEVHLRPVIFRLGATELVEPTSRFSPSRSRNVLFRYVRLAADSLGFRNGPRAVFLNLIACGICAVDVVLLKFLGAGAFLLQRTGVDSRFVTPAPD